MMQLSLISYMHISRLLHGQLLTGISQFTKVVDACIGKLKYAVPITTFYQQMFVIVGSNNFWP